MHLIMPFFLFKNQMKQLCVFVFLFLSVSLQSQNIFVVDQNTGFPINHVFIYNEQKSVTTTTNDLGIANLSIFGKEDVIVFQHPSYYDARYSMVDIALKKYKISLILKQIDLDEVVVSANRWESDIKELPNQIQVIKNKDIVFNNPATTADLLSAEAEVFVQKSQLGGGSPMLRGFGANQILFITDGIRMNNAIYRSGNLQNILQTDVNVVESAEIIFGPGTNMYGSDALGGVIDFHTLQPKLTTHSEWSSSGNAIARFGSADFEKTLHADINFGNNQWAFLVSFSYSDFDDLKMGNKHNAYAQRPNYVTQINGADSMVVNDNPNEQKYSGYNQLSFISKVKQQFTKTADWTLSFYFTKTDDVPRYDRLLQYSGEDLRYAVWNYFPQQWMMNSLEMNFTDRTKIYDHATYILAYQNVKEGRNDRGYKKEWLTKRVDEVNIFSLNADFDKALRWKNHIFYGFEAVYNKVNSTGEEENINTGETLVASTRYPDGGTDYVQAGAYFSFKKNFDQKPLTFQAGVRFSYVYLHSIFNDTSFYNFPYSDITLKNGAITGNAGIVYHPGRWQIKFNLSSGFRAPNLDDVAKVFDSEQGNVIVPNEDLEAEYLYNTDLGVLYRFGNTANIELTGFFSYLDNAMVRRDFEFNGSDSIPYDGEMSKVQAIVNAGYAVIYGGTLVFNLRIIRNLTLNSKLTLIKGYDDEGYAIRHAPPLYGSSSLTYEYEKLKMAVSAYYNTEVPYANLAPSERSKAYLYATDANGDPYAPGWWTLNFRSSYAFSESFILTFGVENILNYRYRPYSSGITAPGINVVAGLRISF